MSLPLNNIYHMDCMEGMKQFPDKYFELAICDPPYGIKHSEVAGKQSGTQYGKAAAPKAKYTTKDWDKATPDKSYFDELIRVSKNQIIWGANYMVQYLPVSMGWIVWDKENGSNGFSDCELAYSSFDRGLRKFDYMWNGMLQKDMKNKENRIHPTQKPVALYKWILKNYSQPGDKILDTHGGSFSSVIACLEMGFEYIAFEIDEEYYKNGLKRIETYLKQPKIFTPEQIQPKQLNLL